MSYTLVTYESGEETLREAAEKIACIIANAKVTDDVHSLQENKYDFKVKLTKQAGITFRTSSGEEYQFPIDERHTIINTAIELAKVISEPKIKLNRGELKEAIDVFLKSHNTLALATGWNRFVRCTPIEYEYINDCLYIITEGGRKFVGLFENEIVSLAIFEPYVSMGELKGMQITGSTKLVPYGTEEYYMPLERKNISRERLANLPITMHVVKVIPAMIEFLNSDFRKMGFDAKQQYQI